MSKHRKERVDDWTDGKKQCGRCGGRFGAFGFFDLKDPYCKHCIEAALEGAETTTVVYQSIALLPISPDVDSREWLAKDQKNRCAICGKPAKTLVLDHDHKTGFVRGMLCNKCNSGLGMFEDSMVNLSRAIAYLSMHQEHPSGVLYKVRKTPKKAS